MATQQSRPRSSRKLSDKEFADLRHTVQIRSQTNRGVQEDLGYATPVPREMSVQLTYKCNLRCLHCYQWSEDGFFRDFSHGKAQTEISPDLFQGLLEYTDETRAKVFLWGGEPLMHSRFDEIAGLLEAHPRTVNMCTNGLLLKRNVDSLLRIGDGLNLLISLDGLGDAHDALRGRNTFRRTLDNLEYMLGLQQSGEYRGEISLSCMVSDETAPRMYQFMEWAEERGVNTVYFQFPWYISPAVAAEMDALYAERFDWLGLLESGAQGTWHSYSYRLSDEMITVVQNSMRRLAERVWTSRVRYQPQVMVDEAPDFLRGSTGTAQKRHRCLAVSNRMEIHADGKVSSCKFFPEFVIGDLTRQSPEEVWQGEAFRRVRTTLQQTHLMPVCSKCILLYLNGV
ncbi:radical SAM protein [Streptomyces sp. NPDC033538]|uniref:radical SAM protein n=1 Tax=Streptomyces sp. NPDC033538 TaxID=3155367 RepID=UPI0033E1D1AA